MPPKKTADTLTEAAEAFADLMEGKIFDAGDDANAAAPTQTKDADDGTDPLKLEDDGTRRARRHPKPPADDRSPRKAPRDGPPADDEPEPDNKPTPAPKPAAG